MEEHTSAPARSNRGRWVGGVIIVVGVAAVFSIRVGQARGTRAASGVTQPAAVPTVTALPAQRRDIVDNVSITGTIRASGEVDVFTKLPGRVERVAVKVGDKVKAGQLLAVIEHRELELQTRQSAAQLGVTNAGVEQARLNLESAEKQYTRMKTLAAQGGLTEAELERLANAHRGAQMGVRSAEAQRALSEAASGIVQAQLDNSRVTSPIAGVVVARHVQLGSQANPAQPLFKVQALDDLKLEGSVTAAEFHLLHLGQAVHVRVDELPDQEFAGRVMTLSPSLDASTRRAPIEIQVTNVSGKLLANMFARGSIEIGRREGVLSVTSDAVLTDGAGPLVYVVRDGKAEQVRPQVEPSDGEFTAVRSGLTEKDLVIVAGHTQVTPGGAVQLSAEKVQ